ncbi:MAG: hypothetical protein QXG00_04685 [Candidatus Woesearchaeota archaeon]
MRILIVCNYEGSKPYIPNLVERLLSLNYNVDILDIGNFYFIKTNNVCYIDTKNKIHPLFFKIPLMRKYLRIVITKNFIKKLETKYDVVNLHYASKIYSHFLKELKIIGGKLILNMWGSDFYRDRFNKNTEFKQLKVYDYVDKILFASEYFLKTFNNYYLATYRRNYQSKLSVVRWGIDIIDKIKFIRNNEDKKNIRQYFNIPEDYIVITVGYNASIFQQHTKIIQKIKELKEKFFKKIYLLLPMTYREDKKNYIEEVRSLLNSFSVKYLILINYISDLDIARLRLVTDIAINMQMTDDLNASIQEHLFAGNIVVCGDWLPYKVYTDNGIHIEFVSFDNLSAKLYDISLNFDSYSKKFNENVDKVYKFSSWEYNIQSWVNVFENS